MRGTKDCNINFWEEFDALIDAFNQDQKTEISSLLIEAKCCVTGLTDGWFEFVATFEKIVSEYRHVMRDEQFNSAMRLSDMLKRHFPS